MAVGIISKTYYFYLLAHTSSRNNDLPAYNVSGIITNVQSYLCIPRGFGSGHHALFDHIELKTQEYITPDELVSTCKNDKSQFGKVSIEIWVAVDMVDEYPR